MADRTVSVRLQAIVGQYISAMGAAGRATMGLGGILAGAAAVSAKLAIDFEAAMTKIAALVGVSRKQVDAWGDQILDLARTLPQSPKELADAMFFVTSAGFRGAEAMEVLKVGAQAAAAGLGDTAVVVDVLTSALNAYKGTGLTAIQVTDMMVAAVREGKMPVEALASSMGQVLSIAAELGVPFKEVAAAIASATRVGQSASKMVTGLQFLMTRLIDPTDEAAVALAKYGISANDLRTSLQEEGLLATLQMLKDTVPIQEFADAVGGARGLRSALALVGKNAEQVEEIFRKLGASGGSTLEALKKKAEDTGFQWDVFVSSVQATAIEFGATLLPALKGGIDALNLLVGALGPIAPHLDKVVLAFLAFKGIGFIAGLFDRLALSAGKLPAVLPDISYGLGTVAAKLRAIAPAAIAAMIAVPEIADEFEAWATSAADLADALASTDFRVDPGLAKEIESIVGQSRTLWDMLSPQMLGTRIDEEITEIIGFLKELASQSDLSIGEFNAALSSPEGQEALLHLAQGAAGARTELMRLFGIDPKVIGETGAAASGAADGVDDLGGAAGDASGHLGELVDEMDQAAAAAGQLQQALDILFGREVNVEKATIDWHNSLKELAKELRQGEKTLRGSSQASLENRQAVIDQIDAAGALANAITQQTGSVKAGEKAFQGFIKQIINTAVQAGFSRKEIAAYLHTLNLTPDQIRTLIKLLGIDSANSKVSGYKGNLNTIPSVVETRVITWFQTKGHPSVGGHPTHGGGRIGSPRSRRIHAGGRLRSDEELLIGQRGERMLSAAQERSIQGSLRSMQSILGAAAASAGASRAPSSSGDGGQLRMRGRMKLDGLNEAIVDLVFDQIEDERRFREGIARQHRGGS